jgi:hypothetical protein
VDKESSTTRLHPDVAHALTYRIDEVLR